MKKKKIATAISEDNGPIQLNSNYFFERALKSLDKQRYDKALKYFKKAVDYEPENPINYCNVAGVLSEMGNYNQANDILKKVIEDIDPKMTEVYFYMATNFAHMEQYEQAEDTLIQYLEEDEAGHFLEEAEEMIEFLQTELPDPKKITKVRAKAGMYEHTYARELLEQGQFAEAIALLEKIVEAQPDFLAAVNNLALAYYYVGFKEEAKHYMYQVLEQDASNLHALCNLAIYHYYESETEQLNRLLPILIKVEPFYQEHLYKLATTLGIMKEHKGALKHFERLIKLGEGTKDGSIFHYAAIASLNIKAYDKALRYWQLAYHQGEYEPALYYIRLTEQLKNNKVEWTFTYSYVMSIEEQFVIWKSLMDNTQSIQFKCIAKAYFYYTKESGNSSQKLNGLNMISTFVDDTYLEQLYDYLLYPLEDKQVKRKVISLLLKVYNDKLQQAYSINHRYETELNHLWLEVIEQLVQGCHLLNTDKDKQKALELVFIYLNAVDITKLTRLKVNVLVASFIYMALNQLNKEVTYKYIADQFHLSSSTISHKVKQIEHEILSINDNEP